MDPAAILHRLVADVYNGGNFAVVEALYPSVVQLNGERFTVEERAEAIRALPDLIPGFGVTIEVLGVADGFVATAWTIHHSMPGHVGASSAAQPTISRTSLRLFRVVEGKIVAEWLNWAAREQLHALGLRSLPTLPASYAK